MEFESMSEPGVLKHQGRNIEFDALEAKRALLDTGESVTSRENAIPVDLVWRNLVFDVPLKKGAMKDELESKPDPNSVLMGYDGQSEPPSQPSNGIADQVTPLKPDMRRILHGLNGQVRCGQVLAIMGASGSGKTTLLNTLSGRMKSSKKCTTGGRIYINGQSRHFSTFPHIAKFVEQDDTTMFADLTVREQILYSARLALPGSVSEARKIARVDKIIQELGLSKCQNTYIGSELTRGVSGGERRRAAIGVELVTDPSLIFLDEPTTGLDSFSALNVMSSLRHLARNGRTVVTTIHQPRSSIFHLFDILCLISEGRTVYFGPAKDAAAYFANLGFRSPPHFNVADFVIDVLSIDHRSEAQETKTISRVQYVTEHYRQNVEPRFVAAADAYEGAHTQQPSSTIAKYSNSPLKEFSILAHRTVKLIFRDRQINFTRLGQTLFFALLLGLIWLDTGRDETTEGDSRAVQGVIFFLAINQCFDSAFGIIFSYAAERAVVNRERASGYYRDLSYFVGRQLCELPRAVFFNTLMIVIVYFMAGLRETAGAFFTLLLIAILLALAGEGLAQTFSVFAGDEQTAAAIVPVAVIFQVLFGGFFISPVAMPAYIRWARFLSFIYYGFTAAVQNQFVGDGINGVNLRIIDELSTSLSLWENVAVVAGFVVALKLAYLAALSVTRPRFDRRL